MPLIHYIKFHPFAVGMIADLLYGQFFIDITQGHVPVVLPGMVQQVLDQG